MNQDSVHQRLQTLRLIAGALMASVVVYIVIPLFALEPDYEPPLVPFPAMLAWALTIAAAVAILAGRFVERGMVASADRRLATEDTTARFQAFQAAVVVGFALREAAAVLGLVLTLLSGQMLWVVGLSAAALLAMAGAWPSRRRLQEFVARTGPPPIDPSR